MAHGDHLKYQAKPKAGRQTLFRLTSYLVCDRLLLSVIGVLIVLSIAANLGGSYLLRPIINRYIIPGDFLGLGKMLGILIGVYLTGVFAVYVEYRLLNKIGQRTVARMREDLFRKMEQLPVGYFDTHQHGDLMSRYTNDMDRISDALTDSLSDMLSSALTVVGIFCLMLVISPILTLVTLVTVPLMFWSARGIVRKSRQYFKAQQASLGSINGYIEEMISGQKVVKVFGHEQKAISDFEELNQDLKGKSLKAQFYSGLMMPVMQNLSTLNYVLITIVGALLAIFRGFDVGGLAAFLQYSRQFGRPINELASLYNSIQAALAGAERIFEVIDEQPEAPDLPEAVNLEKVKGEVVMKEVWFGYRPEKMILKGISFQAAAGRKIALVGATGAGKTTILSMLPRFFDIRSGEIRIDRQEIRCIHRNSLRRSMAIVLQDTHLFTGTVMENIAYGKPGASFAEIQEAAKLAGAEEFIQKLPEGYDTYVGERGVKLSGGQKQRISIARVFLKNPPILILDEATSALDNESEKLVQDSLERLAKGRTTFTIAHRLTTIQNASEILVLTSNGIEERGTHEELLARKGIYYRLYNG